MKVLTVLLLTTSATFAQLPPPPDGTYTNNPPPLVTYTNTPRPVEHGAIHTTTTDTIEWWNLNNHIFSVEHRTALTGGSWSNIGGGLDWYIHDNPAGFYRVIEDVTLGAFPNLIISPPTTNFPSEFHAFNPPISNYTPSASAPAIAEFTRGNNGGDTLALTGEGLAPCFVFGDNTTNTFAGSVEFLDGRVAAVTVPPELSTNEVYLMWPINLNGYGYPVPINKALSWWVGPDHASTGETFSIYGDSLKLGDGNSYVYIEELNRWLTNSAANPYKADFVVPSDIEEGEYTLWPHNGHGKEWGFGRGLSLTIESAANWEDGDTYDVTSYGAIANDSTNDLTAIHLAIADAEAGDTVYFPEGEFNVLNKIQAKEGVRLLGEGINKTIITSHEDISGNGNSIIKVNVYHATIQNLTVLMGSNDDNQAMTIDATGAMYLTMDKVRVSQLGTSPAEHESPLRASNGGHIYLKECEFILSKNVYFEQSEDIIIDTCDFYAINDANSLIGGSGRNMAIFNCTVQSYNRDDNTDGAGWGKGRFYAGSNPQNFYFGDNTTTDMCPRRDPSWTKYEYHPTNEPNGWRVDPNSGEQFLWEGLYAYGYGAVTDATTNTATISGWTLGYADVMATIVEGRGLGQSRYITSSSTGGVITISENWAVIPDTSSVINIGGYGNQVVIYNNFLDGDIRATDPRGHTDKGASDYLNYTATSGVNAYGGFSGLIVDNNIVQETRQGFDLWTLAKYLELDGVDQNIWQPNFFNVFKNNTCNTNLYGVAVIAGIYDNYPIYETDPSLMLNIFRNNEFNYSRGGAVAIDGFDVVTDMTIWQNNEFNDFYELLSLTGTNNNQLWLGCTTNGVSWSPSEE